VVFGQDEHQPTKKIKKSKAIAFTQTGRLKIKWEDDVKQD
jgi:hypothetical protein